MSSHHRAMFQMIKSDEISKKLHPWINPEYLPEHLGGTSATYTSTVNVEFDPHRSRFPITTTPGYRKADGKPTDHKVDANLPSSTA